MLQSVAFGCIDVALCCIWLHRCCIVLHLVALMLHRVARAKSGTATAKPRWREDVAKEDAHDRPWGGVLHVAGVGKWAVWNISDAVTGTYDRKGDAGGTEDITDVALLGRAGNRK